jgi:hypothetical protein
MIPMPKPKPNSSIAHVAAVYESWACRYYGAPDPMVAYRKLVGARPNLATLRRFQCEHPALYAVVRVYRPVQPAPVIDRGATKRQWEAAIAARTARGMTRYQAISDIGKTDQALWEAYR